VITRLFGLAGVDYGQWRALVIVALKLDFRVSSVGQTRFGREARAISNLILQAFLYTLFGAFIAFFLWINRDLFLVGTVAATYVAFIVGTAVLLDHNSVITSPADYAILGFRPVASRTYFLVKLTNILVYTTALTWLAAWLPITVALLRYGWPTGLALTLAIFASSTSMTLAIALGYAWALQVVGRHVIERVLSYVQFFMSIAVYGGQLVMSRMAARSALMAMSLPKTPVVLLYPGTWFASYLEIANGRTSAMEILPALASIGALVFMASKLGGRLSLEYSERLGALTTAERVRASTARTAGRAPVLFNTGEARAVALLVRSQFRHDLRFRMGVLGVVPFTLIYMWLGLRDGALTDPFVAGAAMQSWPVTMVILTCPSMLRMHLTNSDAYRASWIFFTTPCDRMQIVRASKNVLIAGFLVPYLLFVFAIYAYVIRQVVHVAVHIAFLGLFAHLLLQVALLVDPALPFSRPMQKSRNSSLFLLFTISTVVIGAIVQLFAGRLYASPMATVLAMGAILAVGAAIDWLTRARVERQSRLLEFEY
jgi:ABC-2 type transport system permease protein